MAIRLADTARPNNYVDAEHPGSFPVAYADDVWFADGTRLSEKSFDGQSIQVEELPLASADELGNIYQYVGETGTYTKGYFYECVSDGEVPPTYSWKEVSGGGYHFSEDFVKEEDEVSLAVSQRIFTGTQAEWDALSMAVKKTYGQVNITDDDAGENLDYYSTTETKTNKIWIDGKPIYRKVITDWNIGTSATYDVTSLNIDTLISVGGNILHNNGNTVPFPYYFSSSDGAGIYLNNTKSSLNTNIAGSYATSATNLKLILEYTKEG